MLSQFLQMILRNEHMVKDVPDVVIPLHCLVWSHTGLSAVIIECDIASLTE